MRKLCDLAGCIWADQIYFCETLKQAVVPLDKKWPSTILWLRGIDESTILSEKQKTGLQNILLSIFQKKDFSESTFAEIERNILTIMTERQAEEIQKVMREAAELARDVQSIFGKRYDNIACMVSSMDSDQAKGVEPAVTLAGLRGTLKEMLVKMADDIDSLKDLSWKDDLTGLANRRSFDAFLHKAVTDWEAYETPVSMIMLDIDHFKNVNDTFGHHVGDQVLQALAERLTKTVQPLAVKGRGNVFVARYGGEEFAVVLCGEIASRAAVIAEIIRKMVSKIVVFPLDVNDADGGHSREKITPTICCGVSEPWKGWQDNRQARLVDAADKALYRAKSNGRNCVMQYLHEGEERFKLITPC